MSWGSHAFKNYFNKALVWKVQGFLHKGFVSVTYNAGADLFVVEILNTKYKVLNRFEDIYVDELIQVIDRAVEKNGSDEEYTQKVNNAHYSF